jgi:hypothetical protein
LPLPDLDAGIVPLVVGGNHERSFPHTAGSAAHAAGRIVAHSIVELDAGDIAAIDANGATGAAAAAFFEFDDAIANGDELAANTRAIAHDQGVCVQTDWQSER